MSGQIINSAPYSAPCEYSANGIDYSEFLAAGRILDKIRGKNSALADELSQKPVTSAYLQQVLEHMSPPPPKTTFALPPKEPAETDYVRSLEEIVVFNFNKRQTNELSAAFAVYDGTGIKSIDIGMKTLRALEAVFQTPGRTIPEMEAIIYLQALFLRNVPNIRYKRELMEFLNSLPRDNVIVAGVLDKLTVLCETA